MWYVERYEFQVDAAIFGAVVKNTGEGGLVMVTLSVGTESWISSTMSGLYISTKTKASR